MMVLLDGEPSGKAGSLCKRSLKAFTLLFISVCKLWVRISLFKCGMERLPELGEGGDSCGCAKKLDPGSTACYTWNARSNKSRSRYGRWQHKAQRAPKKSGSQKSRCPRFCSNCPWSSMQHKPNACVRTWKQAGSSTMRCSPWGSAACTRCELISPGRPPSQIG